MAPRGQRVHGHPLPAWLRDIRPRLPRRRRAHLRAHGRAPAHRAGCRARQHRALRLRARDRGGPALPQRRLRRRHLPLRHAGGRQRALHHRPRLRHGRQRRHPAPRVHPHPHEGRWRERPRQGSLLAGRGRRRLLADRARRGLRQRLPRGRRPRRPAPLLADGRGQPRPQRGRPLLRPVVRDGALPARPRRRGGVRPPLRRHQAGQPLRRRHRNGLRLRFRGLRDGLPRRPRPAPARAARARRGRHRAAARRYGASRRGRDRSARRHRASR